MIYPKCSPLFQRLALFGLLSIAIDMSTQTLSADLTPSSIEQRYRLSKQNEGAVHFNLRMAGGALPTRFEVRSQVGESRSGDIAIILTPDKEGRTIAIEQLYWNSDTAKWTPRAKRTLDFWPAPNNQLALKTLETDAIAEKSWQGRLLHGVVRKSREKIGIWLEGRLILTADAPDSEVSHFILIPGEKSVIESVETTKPIPSQYEPVDLTSMLESNAGKKLDMRVIGNVPYELRDQGHALLSLSRAGWPDWRQDPESYTESYDAGPTFVGDPRMPWAQVPRYDYIAAHLLAYAEPGEGFTNRLTLRAGSREGGSSNKSQVLIKDFTTEIPRVSLGVPEGGSPEVLQQVELPLPIAFAQDVEKDVIDLEITKEIRLATHAPDLNRYRWRPLGLPSGVRIAALTLELSPIQLQLHAANAVNVFEHPEAPRFVARLTNITEQEQPYVLSGTAFEDHTGVVPPRKEVDIILEISTPAPGYHPFALTLQNGKGKVLLSRQTAFVMLPKADRLYLKDSPFGTWDFGGAHFTSDDHPRLGLLYKKLGLRYGMFHAPVELRERYGVRIGNEFTVRKLPGNLKATYEKRLEKDPDLLPHLLMFHEDVISGAHATRIPDLFHDRKYNLNPDEKKRFHEMIETATTTARYFRQHHPDVKIQLGNGGLTLREEFLRSGFPSELFDTLGNESGSFGRLPETQPPDVIANNASLWMDRQMLDSYGYADKGVSQCYEILYPCTNPGNLSMETQANYFVRHALHSLAWEMPQIRMGLISDAGNSYYFGNWGGAGLFEAHPALTPKPAAAAVATLTRMLDGASYDGFVDTGSESAYLLRFRKRDNTSLLVYWNVRGKRPYHLEIEGGANVRKTKRDGTSEDLLLTGGALSIIASPDPYYLELPVGASLKGVRLGDPVHIAKPGGKVSRLDPLTSMEDWQIATERNALLEFYNPMTPRRIGDFSFEPVASFEGQGPALKVTPKPLSGGKATMPMVVGLITRKPLMLPGKPAEIGLWVNGNSGWGRVIFELEDASGQRWISIGAKAKGGSPWMADWLTPELLDQYEPGEIADWNTDDVFGLSRINFDGWRYVGFPLPGQYPGEGFHWPLNGQWRSDKDGVVHYPLVLKKLIVELPEKVLHLTRFAPPKRTEIYLRGLVSIERDIDAPKVEVSSYIDSVQITSE